MIRVLFRAHWTFTTEYRHQINHELMHDVFRLGLRREQSVSGEHKGVWWMARQKMLMKDVAACEKLR